MATLNLFPARVAIGTVRDDGFVMMTPEFFRALTDLLQRVGGPSGNDMGELEALFSIETADAGTKGANAAAQDALLSAEFSHDGQLFSQLAARIEALETQLSNQADAMAQATQAKAYAEYAQIEYSFAVPPVDWEHPGKIGAKTANTGAFTLFGCNGKAPQTSFALGAAATDLPTVIALANNLRTMSINNGIGS